jgi:hypothetical protein
LCASPGLPDFSRHQNTKTVEIHQITTHNGYRIYQMTVKYSKWP